jgi:hypothetical protein
VIRCSWLLFLASPQPLSIGEGTGIWQLLNEYLFYYMQIFAFIVSISSPLGHPGKGRNGVREKALATGFFMLHFQFIKKETEFAHKFFKGFPVNTVTTSWPINTAIYQSCIFQFF